MIYLNEVLGDMPDSDLPRARSPIDRIFIAVVGDARPGRHPLTGIARASASTLGPISHCPIR